MSHTFTHAVYMFLFKAKMSHKSAQGHIVLVLAL